MKVNYKRERGFNCIIELKILCPFLLPFWNCHVTIITSFGTVPSFHSVGDFSGKVLPWYNVGTPVACICMWHIIITQCHVHAQPVSCITLVSAQHYTASALDLTGPICLLQSRMQSGCTGVLGWWCCYGHVNIRASLLSLYLTHNKLQLHIDMLWPFLSDCPSSDLGRLLCVFFFFQVVPHAAGVLEERQLNSGTRE